MFVFSRRRKVLERRKNMARGVCVQNEIPDRTNFFEKENEVKVLQSYS